jgi:hypothetical protein
MEIMKIDITIEAPHDTPLSQLIGEVVVRFINEWKAQIHSDFTEHVRKLNKNKLSKNAGLLTQEELSEVVRTGKFPERKKKNRKRK